MSRGLGSSRHMIRPIRAREGWVLACAFAVAAVAAGCAKKGPPSGGPPDLDPPTILSVSPDSGAAGVARGTRLMLTFSEGMEPRTASDAVELAPKVDIRQRRWSGRTLTLVLADSLQSDQVYTLFVGLSARDRHGNGLKQGRTVVFTTAAIFPPGTIEGKVQAVGFAAPGTYLWCYPDTLAPDSTARDFEAVGLADDDGAFRISGLKPGRYRVWAFADLNRNRSFEPGSDVLAPAETTLTISPEVPVASGLTLKVVNPKAPGRFQGAIQDSVAGDGGQLRLIVISERDTTRKLLYDVPDRGGFDFKFDPGTYTVRAFRDLDRNKAWKRDTEPASAEIRITITPGGVLENVVFHLDRPEGAAAPEE